ncbi:TPA: hypothetical protein OB631_004979 [Escherichia coli]|nr:hypothetical protein [Escherichia coli]
MNAVNRITAFDRFAVTPDGGYVPENVFDGLLKTVPSTTQIGYKARFVKIHGQIVLIPEPEFLALVHLLDVMYRWQGFPKFTFNYLDMNIIENMIREQIGGTWSSHWSPSASIRKLAKRGVLSFKRESVTGRKNTFNYIVTINGSVDISDDGILCIGSK